MGQEITQTAFAPEAWGAFQLRLEAETRLLRQALEQNCFAPSAYVGGFELEAWLIDRNFFPAPDNEAYLAHLNHPLVVPELSKFNVELNGTPQMLRGDALSRMERELTATWRLCLQKAHDLGNSLAMIGILPTVRDADLTLRNISPLNRYRVLNAEVLRRRGGQPIRMQIDGIEHMQSTHTDVMLEAAATSFQVHLQTPIQHAVRYYNASILLSAPLVALSANSPFLFEKSLWEETRIPVFEQAVDMGCDPARVTFGTGYLRESVAECFEENLAAYAVLLPVLFDHAPERFKHLRLHNGTIWRWNRPLIGFDDRGTPHVRIEHRVMPAGPSILDQMANAAFYFGTARFLAELENPPEADLPFDAARENFYQSARYGLRTELTWLNGQRIDAHTLLSEELLPMARQGLRWLGIDEADIERYLNVIEARLHNRQTGAAWQRAMLQKQGGDFFKLTAAYLENQRSAAPVHEWAL